MNIFNPLFPLLIPSFSSKGNLLVLRSDGKYVFDNYDLLQVLDVKVANSYLVSAYDIFYGYMPQDPQEWPNTDYLFIDSGGYEISDTYDLDEHNNIICRAHPWDIDKMKQVYHTVTSCAKFSGSTIVLSGYDLPESYEDQLNSVLKLAKEFPNALVNFIVKLVFPFEQLLKCITENMEYLCPIPIIGFTEKELGDTVQKRLLNLISLKKLLTSFNWKGKIHVFGGLEPNLSILYYYAGADIFDGLSWQRMCYRTNSTLRDPVTYNISRSEFENKYLMMIDNLAVMRDLAIDLSCKSNSRINKMIQLEELLNNTGVSISRIINDFGGQI